MNENDDVEIVAIIKKYAQLETRAVVELASELRSVTQADANQRRAARDRILKEVELHAQAEVLVEEAVAKYREDLYFVARRLADDEFDSGIVTRAHVRQAQATLTRPRHKYTWGDVLLAIGGLMLGGAIPHIVELGQGAQSPSVTLIIGGVLGGVLFGMGILAKVKG